MTDAEKAAAFDGMVCEIAAYGDQVFEGTNGRFVVVAWIDGHCDSIKGLSVSATPESRAEMRQALAFAAQYDRETGGEQA